MNIDEVNYFFNKKAFKKFDISTDSLYIIY